MKSVLQFIKTYLISLICAVVAVGAVVFGAMGWSSDQVTKEMKQELTKVGASNIQGLRGSAKNAEVIAAEKERAQRFAQEYKATVAEAKTINRREVLMPGVFPRPERIETPDLFKETYKKHMELLYRDLDADTLPTEAEIKEEQQNVDDLIELEREKRVEAAGDESTRTPTRTPPTLYTGRTPGPPYPPGGTRYTAGSPGSLNDIPAEERAKPKYNAEYRARVAKAKSILCYYDKDVTFQVDPLAYNINAPTPGQMWIAQVGLWVQEDVVKAIADLNNKATADIASDTDPCVEDTPVKRIVSIRVRGYVLDKQPETTHEKDAVDVAHFPMLGSGSLPEAAPSLTGRKCNDQYDVVRFVVTLVIDQTKMQQVIDAITRANFYECIGASYDDVDQRAARQQGYFYGTAPAVYATLEFEGYMFRDIYQDLMPDEIKKALGIPVKEQ